MALFPFLNELLICAYPKNLVKMGLIVEGMAGHGSDSIESISPGLFLLAWHGLPRIWLRLRFVNY